MTISIHPSDITGRILSPRSKSSMQRACAAALLRQGITEIRQPGISNDDLAAIDVIQKLGAFVDRQDEFLRVESEGVRPLHAQIDCGESGLGIRMFTPIAALSAEPLEIIGSGSLVSRPMDFFDDIFPQLGIHIHSRGGRLPLQIQGPLQPKNISIDGSLSSQFLTGLLMAYSVAAKSRVEIRVRDLKSRPYIDLTLSVMRSFGMSVPTHIDYECFIFDGKATPIVADPVRYTVEGDWSGASFLIAAGLIAGDLTITGLQSTSVQADRAILDAVEKAGGSVAFDGNNLQVKKSRLQAFHFDATECPDLFPPLVTIAAYAEGTTIIDGVSRLAHKESDRGKTLQEEFGKLGIQIRLEGDRMYIDGAPGRLKGAATHSHHDHRIAMAVAVAALGAEDIVSISEPAAVKKSYPAFFDDLASLGVRVDKG